MVSFESRRQIFSWVLAILLLVVATISAIMLLERFRQAPDPSSPPSGTPTPATAVEVARVVDGDTLDVREGDEIARVRLLGIDAPESVDPRQPVECFGREASAKLTELVAGQQVRLAADPTQADRDTYGRLLRYVYRVDGAVINELLIREGYAHEYTFRGVPYQLQSQFTAAENHARTQGRGLWAPGACQS